MDTKTTKVSTINPRIIGLYLIFLISSKFVLRPIADKAIIIKKLEVFERVSTKLLDKIPLLRITTAIKKNTIK